MAVSIRSFVEIRQLDQMLLGGHNHIHDDTTSMCFLTLKCMKF